jgi:hypothetical protein
VKWGDLVQQTSRYLKRTGQGDGRLLGMAKQITTDSLNQFSAQYNAIVSEELGFEWYMYVGSNLETTREFCSLLTKKKYVHKSEIPKILNGSIDGKKYKINDKTGLWVGAIEGTNVANFPINRGGYQCGHQLMAVAKEIIPLDIRRKYDNK